jgi:hypothetical protein
VGTLVKSNKIEEYYLIQKKSIVLNNVRYSSQIFTIWTDAQRKDLGIVPSSYFRITS